MGPEWDKSVLGRSDPIVCLPHWGQDSHAGAGLEKRPKLGSCSTLTLVQEREKQKSQQFPGRAGNSAIPWVGKQMN